MAGPGSWRTEALPPEWERLIRPRILARDGGMCLWGLVPGEAEPGYVCSAAATDVDHIIRGGGHHDANLRSLCGPHHQAKSSGEGGRAAGALRTAMAVAKYRPAEPHPGLRRTA